MKSSFYPMRYCVVVFLLLLLACGGGGEDSAPTAALEPNISLSQSAFDFAGIVLDNSSDGIFVIQNTGNGSLRIGQISGASQPFSIYTDTCSNATLSASQTCSVKVRFSPTGTGSFTASLSVPSNDPDSGTLHINVSGIGYGLNVWVNQITATCPTITAEVTVTNPRNNIPLTTLTDNELKIYHNGQLQSIDSIANLYPSHVSLMLAIDASGSTANVLPDIKSAAKTFINQLTADDEAAICKFNGLIDCDPSTPPLFRVGDAPGKSALNTFIDSIATGNGTFLYDAAYQAIDRADQAGAAGKRKAVIILSDGADETTGGVFPGSVHTLDQVISHAVDLGIPVFTIFYVDPNYHGGNFGKTEIMQRLARETGGQYYNPSTVDLPTIFQQITNTLSNKYTLTYRPATCTGTVLVNVQADWTGLHGEDSRTLVLP